MCRSISNGINIFLCNLNEMGVKIQCSKGNYINNIKLLFTFLCPIVIIIK